MRYVYFVRGKVHAALAEVSIASVRKVDPAAVVHVYNDETGTLPIEVRGADQVRRTSRALLDPIMLANLEAQARAMYETPEDQLVAFLDTDVLLTQPIEPALPDREFDLAPTWRDHALVGQDGEKITAVASVMPYNYGVILARGGFTATECFLWLRERVRRMSAELQKWYGNQVALSTLVGAPPKTGFTFEVRQIPWTPTDRGNAVRVVKLPCDMWNYTPQAEGEDTSSRVALHFKGGKRSLMKPYALGLGLEWPELLP